MREIERDRHWLKRAQLLVPSLTLYEPNEKTRRGLCHSSCSAARSLSSEVLHSEVCVGANVRHKSHLRAVFDVMALVEAQVAQVVGRGSLVGFSGLRGQRKV